MKNITLNTSIVLMMIATLSLQSCSNTSKTNEQPEQETPEQIEAYEQVDTPSTKEEVAQTEISSIDKWTGASTIDELKQKLDGTYWHLNEGGLIYQYHFSNGRIIKKTCMASSGKWDDDDTYIYSSYKIDMKRDSNGRNYVDISFGYDGNEKVENAECSISFFKKCTLVGLFQFGSLVGELEYGEYSWSDEL